MHDGTKTAYHIIPEVIKQLKGLKRVLESLESYRFHASSLLLSYEGCDNVGNGDSNAVGVHMIDFAHSTFGQTNFSYKGPDADCLLAIDNLISILNDILKSVS